MTMGPGASLKSCFRKYFTFSGRAARSEFWWFWGLVFAGSLVLAALELDDIGSLFFLATFIPWFAAASRRMHDTDRSGAFLFLPFGTMLVGVYTVLFSMLLPLARLMSERLGKTDISPETTLGELNELLGGQTGAFGGVGFPGPSPWAFVVLGAGFVWLIYLLTRPSTPGPNRYGPPPSEVSP
jgi:uncharacterized membrane protein YhaH (DUF805 family)